MYVSKTRSHAAYLLHIGSHMREQVRLMNFGAEFHIDEGCFITELSNIPEDADASIARARVPLGVTTAGISSMEQPSAT